MARSQPPADSSQVVDQAEDRLTDRFQAADPEFEHSESVCHAAMKPMTCDSQRSEDATARVGCYAGSETGSWDAGPACAAYRTDPKCATLAIGADTAVSLGGQP